MSADKVWKGTLTVEVTIPDGCYFPNQSDFYTYMVSVEAFVQQIGGFLHAKELSEFLRNTLTGIGISVNSVEWDHFQSVTIPHPPSTVSNPINK